MKEIEVQFNEMPEEIVIDGVKYVKKDYRIKQKRFDRIVYKMKKEIKNHEQFSHIMKWLDESTPEQIGIRMPCGNRNAFFFIMDLLNKYREEIIEYGNIWMHSNGIYFCVHE
jgi:hypothetical protein